MTLVAAQPGERPDVRGDGGQLRAAVKDGVQAALLVGGEGVGPGHDPAGHGARDLHRPASKEDPLHRHAGQVREQDTGSLKIARRA